MANGRTTVKAAACAPDGNAGNTARPSPAPMISRHTTRHIVILRDGPDGAGARNLRKVTGVRLSESPEFDDTQGMYEPAYGCGTVFRTLRAALVHMDPDQRRMLMKHASELNCCVEPDRILRPVHRPGNPLGPRTESFPHHATIGKSAVDWGLQSTGVTHSRFTGRGVRIAILDTGLDRLHPDFSERQIESHSFVSDGSIDDTNGHGTYCAGIACGPAAPLRPPRYGIAGDAALYVGKVIGDDGSGTDGGILAGLDWAVRNGCAVVCLSVGTPVAAGESYSRVYEQAARAALAAGTLIVAAAGNDSVRPETIAPVDHPANCPSIVAVGAIDRYLRVAPFSCGSINLDGGLVDLAAPGVAIRSSWPRPSLYRTDSGTSMAAPFVAGIACLYAQANPISRGRDLLALLAKSAQTLSHPVRDVGSGLVQAP